MTDPASLPWTYVIDSCEAALHFLQEPESLSLCVDAVKWSAEALAADGSHERVKKEIYGLAIEQATEDARMLTLRNTKSYVASRALWIGKTPNKTSNNWARLKYFLLGNDINWSVWTDWYDARREGRGVWKKSIEFMRCTIPQSNRGEPAKEINRKLEEALYEERRRKNLKTSDEVSDESDVTLVQRPASHRFDWSDRKIQAVQVSEPPFDSLLAQSIIDGILDKAEFFLISLEKNHADEMLTRDLTRTVELLKVSADYIAEGVLLMRARTIASHARAYSDAEINRERSIRAMLDDLSTGLIDLVDCYPGIRKINASRLELEVQASDAVAITEKLDEISMLAASSPIVDESATSALLIGQAEFKSVTESMERASTSIRANYIAERAEIVASRLLDATNFISATTQKAAAEISGLSFETWKEIRKAVPQAAARGVSTGLERASEVLPSGIALTLLTYLGLPWESVALLVPRLTPHVRKVANVAKMKQSRQSKASTLDE